MEAKPKLFFLSLLTYLIACSDYEKMEPSIEETFWVYSYTLPCNTSSTITNPCLAITGSEQLDFNLSELEKIPNEIEGFTFKPHYFQRIQVLTKENRKTGEINRKLIRVLEEEKDFYELLEGSWKVKKFMGEDLPNENFPNGQSVSILPSIRLAISTDACNSISLEIQKVEENRIVSFGSARSTLIGCPSKSLILPFPGLSHSFKRAGNVLTFYNESEEELAVLEKMN